MNAAALTGIAAAVASVLATIATTIVQRRKANADAAHVTTDTAMEAAGGVVAMLKGEMDRLVARVQALETQLVAEQRAKGDLQRRVSHLEKLLEAAGIDHRAGWQDG